MFYEFAIVKEAENAAELSRSVGEFLRSMLDPGFSNPTINIIAPSPGNPHHKYLALEDLTMERSSVGSYDRVTKKRISYFQTIRVVFNGGGYSFLKEQKKWFLDGTTIRHDDGRYQLTLGTVQFGSIMKKEGIVMDGVFYSDGDGEVTTLGWEDVPKGPSELLLAVAG